MDRVKVTVVMYVDSGASAIESATIVYFKEVVQLALDDAQGHGKVESIVVEGVK